MFKQLIAHRYMYRILRWIPKRLWNELSCICASFTARSISSPIRFYHKQFRLEEYPANCLPENLLQRFLDFCYPADLPDRRRQIDLDRELYWGQSSTLLVFDGSDTIVGCVQIVFGDDYHKLPVEYARIVANDNTSGRYDIRQLIPSGTISEIYHCRRSFDLGRMEAIQVLIMLFKAVWAKTVECGISYACISFDPEKPDLRHMYLNKLAFNDPGISLTFGNNRKRWSLLIKDWSYHEKHFAAENATHFYLQTWVRRGLRQKHWKHPEQSPASTRTSNRRAPQKVIIAETVTAPLGRHRKKEMPVQ